MRTTCKIGQDVITFRSGFEKKIADRLTELGVKWEYENREVSYRQKVQSASCQDCGSKNVQKGRKYLTDFYLPEYDIYLEVKGRWEGSDRNKHKAIAELRPRPDIRFVFQYDNWLTKKKKKRYSEWCETHNFEYSVGDVDINWFKVE